MQLDAVTDEAAVRPGPDSWADGHSRGGRSVPTRIIADMPMPASIEKRDFSVCRS